MIINSGETTYIVFFRRDGEPHWHLATYRGDAYRDTDPDVVLEEVKQLFYMPEKCSYKVVTISMPE